MPRLKTLVDYLDRTLKIDEFEDSSANGLQVENAGKVTRVACGVDATTEFFEAAHERGADLLICHHGISWADSLKQITGVNYRRLEFLIRNGIALYAAHLPLDAHPKYGNNAVIARALGLVRLKPFAPHAGREVGFCGQLKQPMTYARFKKLVASKMPGDLRTFDFGSKTVRTVAIVSGGAAGDTELAGIEGIDVFISGEGTLLARNLALEYGINAIFGGHYATETFGVQELGKLLRRRFRLPWEFIDLGIDV